MESVTWLLKRWGRRGTRKPFVVAPFEWRGNRYDSAEFSNETVVLRRKTGTGQEFIGRMRRKLK